MLLIHHIYANATFPIELIKVAPHGAHINNFA
jgi:hypothetical protein